MGEADLRYSVPFSRLRWRLCVSRSRASLAIVAVLLAAVGVSAQSAHALPWSFSFARANQPSYGFSGTYFAPIDYSFNEAGSAHHPRIGRLSTGTYSISFPELADVTSIWGSVQVTAVSSTTRACQVNFWSSETVCVICFDSSGALSDAEFTVVCSQYSSATLAELGDDLCVLNIRPA